MQENEDICDIVHWATEDKLMLNPKKATAMILGEKESLTIWTMALCLTLLWTALLYLILIMLYTLESLL